MSALLLRRLPDERIGSRLARGEAAAFDELYRRYRHRLAAYAGQLLGDPAAGDDVAQSTLMRAYQALRKGKCPERMRPWLYGIAHNLAVDQLRRRRELPAGFSRALIAQPGNEAGSLVEAIASLPERQRRAYVLRELQGLRVDEIARELGLEQAQVEQSLFAARNRLAELLVFGGRLDCVAVRRLVSGPLDASERRGLKTHLRSCPLCRRELGRRGIALSLLPLPSFGWLKGFGGGAVAGGGATAAKVGAAVCVAGIVASVPLTIPAGTDPAAHAAAPLREHRRPGPATSGSGRLPVLRLATAEGRSRPVPLARAARIERPRREPADRRDVRQTSAPSTLPARESEPGDDRTVVVAQAEPDRSSSMEPTSSDRDQAAGADERQRNDGGGTGDGGGESGDGGTGRDGDWTAGSTTLPSSSSADSGGSTAPSSSDGGLEASTGSSSGDGGSSGGSGGSSSGTVTTLTVAVPSATDSGSGGPDGGSSGSGDSSASGSG